MREQMEVRGYLNNYGAGESQSATRVEASLLEIPLSVKVLTRDLMNDQNATDVDEALKNAPEVTPLQGYLRPNYYLMRGFYGLNYRDGIREPIDGTVSINPFELDRIVEVSRSRGVDGDGVPISKIVASLQITLANRVWKRSDLSLYFLRKRRGQGELLDDDLRLDIRVVDERGLRERGNVHVEQPDAAAVESDAARAGH